MPIEPFLTVLTMSIVDAVCDIGYGAEGGIELMTQSQADADEDDDKDAAVAPAPDGGDVIQAVLVVGVVDRPVQRGRHLLVCGCMKARRISSTSEFVAAAVCNEEQGAPRKDLVGQRPRGLRQAWCLGLPMGFPRLA